MALLTVDDLARELKVRNEDLLRELVTMGFEVEGPESHLETDDPVALRAQLVTVLPHREVVEQRIKPTVIRRRMKKKPPSANEGRSAEPTIEAKPEAMIPAEETTGPPEKAQAPLAGGPRKPKKKVKKIEPARIIEMPSKPAAPEESPKSAKKPVQAEAQSPTAEVSPEEVALPPKVEEKPAEAGTAPLKAETPLEKETQRPVGNKPQEARGPTPAAERDNRLTDDKLAKKKKRKEKKMQPAQIIGRIELKKEPPKTQERPRPSSRPPGRPPGRPAGRPPGRSSGPPQSRPRPSGYGPSAPRPLVREPIPTDDKRKRKKVKKTRETTGQDRTEESKVKVRRRKEVILGSDLYGDRRRGGRFRPRGKKVKRKAPITTPKAIKRRIWIPDLVSVSSLAHKMSIKASEVIQHLLTLGVTASMNEGVDFETASIVGSEFGFETESVEQKARDLLPTNVEDTEESLVSRPPVITVMGHVDHGKTSLLDAIRSTHVTDHEAGGITQHIGAYKVSLPRGDLVFLDTPGHEAFTAMRARGANVTDFIVLVVAADDGVMDQTREAINHARAAKVPIIVAVNKIDKVEADKDRVVRELSEHELIPETWGGDTLFTYVSAKTGEGMDEFLEMILLQAEMMELKANPEKKAVGTVVEARLDKGKGAVATVLVGEGSLKLGDAFVAGTQYGKVRAMLDHEGKSVEIAGPATPVEVQGFAGVPEAGEPFIVVDEGKVAKQIGTHRLHKLRIQESAVSTPASVEDLLARLAGPQVKELNVIIKADVQGSAEALKEALLGIAAEEVKVKVIHSAVGGITESDVMLASASEAHIIGFNVRPAPKTVHLAEQEDVRLRLYSVIYEAIDDIRKSMSGMLAPIEKETIVGRAEVRQTFSVARIGVIAGSYVTSGKIERSNQVRLLRDEVPVHQGKILSMKRFKDDVKEALEGYECGIILENYRDVKVGDVIEAFIISQEKAELK